MNTTARMSLALGLLLGALGGCKGNLNDTTLLIATTERVSLDFAGRQVFGNSSAQSMSADGRYVAFQSTSVSLIPGDTNGTSDIFLRDTLQGTTVRVSVEAPPTGAFPNGPDGIADADNANGSSTSPSISANGLFVAFASDATDLITDTPKAPGQTDIYVRDVSVGVTRLVTVPTAGTFANGPSDNPQISPDGRFVVFESVATNLTLDATGGFKHVFVWDANSNTCEMVSKHSGGAVGNGDSDQAWPSEIGSNTAAGIFVVYRSTAGNTVTGAGGPTPSTTHIFRKAIPAGATEMVDAVNAGPVPSNGSSQSPAITPDGRFVVFRSAGNNLAANDVNNVDDIFLHDMTAAPGLLTLVSISVDGVQGSGASTLSAISSDGRYVAFLSGSSNLVAGDTNGQSDVFWRDLQSTGPGSVRRTNVTTNGQQGTTGVFARPSITRDGRFVAFTYFGGDLIVGDSNGGNDVFVNGPLH